MIRHILLWQCTEQAKQQGPEEKRALLDGKFKAMIGKVDGLLDIRLSKNVNGGPYDWALEGLFCSMEAVKNYQTHPLHLEIQQMAKDWVTGRACVAGPRWVWP